jgi:riboflavin kinase / FMN adenylyltransferase
MQLHHGIEGLQKLPPGSTLTIGNFDGIHRGHRAILDLAKKLRHTIGVTSPIAVATFEPHPLTVLRPQFAPPRLTPLPLKQTILEQLGVDHLIILPPTPEVLNLTAESFWQILKDQVRPSHIIEGESFTFGKNRGGSINLLRQWATGTNIELHIAPSVQVALLNLQIVDASSSIIRWLLIHGRARDAAICLGAPYILQGTVIKGFQRGRQLGIPTANLNCGEQLIPAEGVYVGRCKVEGTDYPAAVSIGTLPTFDTAAFQVEAHLIGYTGDLYGQSLQIELIDWIREQRKFADVDELKRAIESDITCVRLRSGLATAEPIGHLA